MRAAPITGRLAAAALLAAAIALPFLVPAYYVQLATKVLIMGASRDGAEPRRRLRRPRQPGHAAFFGLAAYALALAAPQYEAGSLWLTLPLAVAAAALAALAIGALSLRTRGVYFIMVTLAFGRWCTSSSTTPRSPAAPTAPSSISSRRR